MYCSCTWIHCAKVAFGLLHVYIFGFTFPFFFLFFFSARMNSNCTVHAHGFTVGETKCTVHGTYDHFVQKKKILKTRTTALSTHLKIILLQCFQFSVFSKISCIRIGLTYLGNLTIDYIFFIFLTHMPNFVIIRYYLLYYA